MLRVWTCLFQVQRDVNPWLFPGNAEGLEKQTLAVLLALPTKKLADSHRQQSFGLFLSSFLLVSSLGS